MLNSPTYSLMPGVVAPEPVLLSTASLVAVLTATAALETPGPVIQAPQEIQFASEDEVRAWPAKLMRILSGLQLLGINPEINLTVAPGVFELKGHHAHTLSMLGIQGPTVYPMSLQGLDRPNLNALQEVEQACGYCLAAHRARVEVDRQAILRTLTAEQLELLGV